MKVSVVVTTFNRSLQLRRGISTLLNQPTKVPYEIIIVDDGSQDDTKMMVRALTEVGKSKGVEVKYIYLDYPQHRISCYPKNVGIRQADGNVLVFCESELLHVNRTLDQLVGKLEEFPASIPVVTQIWTMGELIYKALSEEDFRDPQRILHHRHAQLTTSSNMNNTNAPNADWGITGSKNCVTGAFFACWKKDMVEIGGWDESFEGFGFDDFDLFMRFGLYGRPLLHCNDIIIVHQWHEKNYPYDIHVAATRNGKIAEARIHAGEYRANIGKEWGKL